MKAGRCVSGAWLGLVAAADGARSRWSEAMRTVGSAEALLASRSSVLEGSGLTPADIHRFRQYSAEPPQHWIDWLAAPGHGLVTAGSDAYPERLAQIPDAPLALWTDGEDPAVLRNPQLAIVGSRHPTGNGRLTARALAASLSAAGISITSGLARGIDAASHQGAIEAAGGTVAVLGSGIDCIYPASNRGLAESIRRRGLIVSEYPPGTPVRAFRFPERNRIIAGLSLGTLVVEATRRSGSLITARLAAEYGREVFAVPGPIQNPQSRGCHKLLRDGARLVEASTDVLVELAAVLGGELGSESHASDAELADKLPKPLANCLDFSPISFDSLVSASGLTAGELSSMLLHLEIQGKIEALPGGRYCRLPKRA